MAIQQLVNEDQTRRFRSILQGLVEMIRSLPLNPEPREKGIHDEDIILFGDYGIVCNEAFCDDLRRTVDLEGLFDMYHGMIRTHAFTQALLPYMSQDFRERYEQSEAYDQYLWDLDPEYVAWCLDEEDRLYG